MRKGDRTFSLEVYTKPTNLGLCLNGDSECPERYKDSVVSSYMRRALTHCSSWTAVNTEINRFSQVLVNNGFPNQRIQKIVADHLQRWYTGQRIPEEDSIKIYYKAAMSSAYRVEERVMKEIIKKGVKPVEENKRIDFIIYYKNRRTLDLVMRNNPLRDVSPMTMSNVVYLYRCPYGECGLRYIGKTTTRLTRRLTCHLQAGAPRNHHLEAHNSRLTRTELEEGTSILEIAGDRRRLAILEALSILQLNPELNTQTDFVLPTLKPRVRNAPANLQFDESNPRTDRDHDQQPSNDVT